MERAAFILLAALCAYIMATGWLVLAACAFGAAIDCKPGYGVREAIVEVVLPALLAVLFSSRGRDR